MPFFLCVKRSISSIFFIVTSCIIRHFLICEISRSEMNQYGRAWEPSQRIIQKCHQLKVPSSASLPRSRKSSRCHSTEKLPTLDSGPLSDRAGHPSSADRPPHLLNCLNEVVTQTVVIYLKICSVMGVSRGPGRNGAPNSTLRLRRPALAPLSSGADLI